jgi:hypothetical protein
VRRLIVDSLRRRVEVMHVDGFRLDLASILARDSAGRVMASPPVLSSWATKQGEAAAGAAAPHLGSPCRSGWGLLAPAAAARGQRSPPGEAGSGSAGQGGRTPEPGLPLA